ncbi:DotD/TraH family lipoprotein [Rhodobacteraceae bacterium]|nr:DotD/TraH family lipoprotein [Paracoccaceae bacterium]
MPQSDEGPSISSLVAQQTADVDREIADAGLYNGVLEPLATGQVILRNPDHAVDEQLLRIVNSEFTGKIEDLVSLIARETGYRVIADGEKPGAPIVIVLVQRDLPAIGALREGFHQAHGRAKLFVDQSAKTMIIHYRRHEASPIPHQEDLEI